MSYELSPKLVVDGIKYKKAENEKFLPVGAIELNGTWYVPILVKPPTKNSKLLLKAFLVDKALLKEALEEMSNTEVANVSRCTNGVMYHRLFAGN